MAKNLPTYLLVKFDPTGGHLDRDFHTGGNPSEDSHHLGEDVLLSDLLAGAISKDLDQTSILNMAATQDVTNA